jgi:hypothetical protein
MNAYVFFGPPSLVAVWSMAVVMVMGDMAGFSSSATAAGTLHSKDLKYYL